MSLNPLDEFWYPKKSQRQIPLKFYILKLKPKNGHRMFKRCLTLGLLRIILSQISCFKLHYLICQTKLFLVPLETKKSTDIVRN
jgi:hypothetical protein